MYHVLYKYLALNNEVYLPGVGMFVLEHEPATVDAANDLIHAPLPVLKFRSGVFNADENFHDFLAHELHIDAFEAMKTYQDFVADLRQEVQLKKWVELPGLGILTQGVRDEIKFKSVPVLKDLYPDISLSKSTPAEVVAPVADKEEQVAIYEDDDYAPKPRNWWWLFAIILFLVGAGAIFYYYYFLHPQNSSFLNF